MTLADRLTKRSASGEPEVFGFGFAVQYFSGTMPWMFADQHPERRTTDEVDPASKASRLWSSWRISSGSTRSRPSPASHTRSFRRPPGRSPWRAADHGPFSNDQGRVLRLRHPVLPRWKVEVTEYGVGGFVILRVRSTPKKPGAASITVQRAHQNPTQVGQAIPARRSVRAAVSPAMFELPPKNARIFTSRSRARTPSQCRHPEPDNRIVEATWHPRSRPHQMAPAAALEESAEGVHHHPREPGSGPPGPASS